MKVNLSKYYTSSLGIKSQCYLLDVSPWSKRLQYDHLNSLWTSHMFQMWPASSEAKQAIIHPLSSGIFTQLQNHHSHLHHFSPCIIFISLLNVLQIKVFPKCLKPAITGIERFCWIASSWTCFLNMLPYL